MREVFVAAVVAAAILGAVLLYSTRTGLSEPVVQGMTGPAFEAFVRATMEALDSCDPRLAVHSQRVALLTVAFAEKVAAATDGPFRDVHFSREQLQAIRYASLLHDIGRLGVPQSVLGKQQKLYGDEMRDIEARFKYAKRTLEAEYLRAQLQQVQSGAATGKVLVDMDRANEQSREELDRLLQVVRHANEPFSGAADMPALIDVSRRTYADTDGSRQPLLTAYELAALSIRRGSFSEQERSQIQSHVAHSFRILSAVPWSGVYSRIPEIVYAHHEKLDGSGYPRAVLAAEIPVESRMITIADTFDALVSPDMPGKRVVPASVALDILQIEAKEGKLDPDLVRLFISAKVYEREVISP